VIDEVDQAAEHAIIVAVDIPSGVGADNGRVYGTAVRADQTVTIQMNKFGMAAEPGRSMAGIVHVEDIGLSAELCAQDEGVVYRPDPEDAAAMLPKRPAEMNKGSAGKLLILAGSPGMAGAAVLAAKAAYRSGAGLVKVAAPWEVVQVLQGAVPEATTLVLGADPEENFRKIEEEMKQYDALAAGPGLGQSEAAGELVRKVLEQIHKPIVLDADGINLAAKMKEVLEGRSGPLILTPHPGEMGRLTGKTPEEVNRDRLQTVLDHTKKIPAVLLLKGAGTLIRGPGENARTWLNPTGNSGMATAGSGDVLTGVIGAFLAAGLTAEDSAVLGAYVHGLAGDLAAERIGKYGLMAGDIAESISKAIELLKAGS
ncbi:MAG: NAD(P)H-hydrate dehydratase, partial [Firmicutes bacterium]|nr:NAD(P)H-hydrate dehydratase [Bacillota bacterium]